MQPGQEDPYQQQPGYQPPADPYQPPPSYPPPGSGAPSYPPPGSGAPSYPPPGSGGPGYPPPQPYGAPQPDYGQQPPQYGQQPPQYGQQPGYGTPPPYGQQPGYGAQFPGGPAGPQNTQGLIAMILGIAAFPLLCCTIIGLPVSIAAVVLGWLGLQKAKTGAATNRGQALAGLICGAVAAVIALGLIIYSVAAGSWNFSTYNDFT
jgi:hypothetical protein